MRRSYEHEADYIEWLKSIGCTLYSPMTENLTNYIDGREWYLNCPSFTTMRRSPDGLIITKLSGNNATSNIQIDTPSRPNLNVGDPTNTAPLTLIVTGKSDRTVDAYTAFFCDGGSNTNQQNLPYTNMAYYGMVSLYYAGITNGNATTWHTYQGVLDSDSQREYHYRDCSLINTLNAQRTNQLTEINRNHFGCKFVTPATYTIKDCYGFSTALSLADIQKIYQHDNA